MNTHLRFALLAFQAALAVASVYLAWQTHLTAERVRALNQSSHCIKAYEGMTLEPGQCAYIEIPAPDLAPPAAPLPYRYEPL